MLIAFVATLWFFPALWLLGYLLSCFNPANRHRSTFFMMASGLIIAIVLAVVLFCFLMGVQTLFI